MEKVDPGTGFARERARERLADLTWRGIPDGGPSHAFSRQDRAAVAPCGAYPHQRDQDRRGKRCGRCRHTLDALTLIAEAA